MRYKLVIAEKPSVAQSLAAVIGATARKDGYLEGISSDCQLESRRLPIRVRLQERL